MKTNSSVEQTKREWISIIQRLELQTPKGGERQKKWTIKVCGVNLKFEVVFQGGDIANTKGYIDVYIDGEYIGRREWRMRGGGQGDTVYKAWEYIKKDLTTKKEILSALG